MSGSQCQGGDRQLIGRNFAFPGSRYCSRIGERQVARSEMDAWADAESKTARTIHAAVFDTSDGLRSFAVVGDYTPRVGKSADGKHLFPVGNMQGYLNAKAYFEARGTATEVVKDLRQNHGVADRLWAPGCRSRRGHS